jgi:hypothetical protein
MLSLFRRLTMNRQGPTLIEIAAVTLLTASAALQVLSVVGLKAS